MMVLCDTSVLVTATIEQDESQHETSCRLLDKIKAKKIKACVALHSLAEFFAVLTALPLKAPVHPLQAKELIEEKIRGHFEVVGLDEKDYWRSIEGVVQKNLRSGAIFDALIFEAAVRRKVSHLVTWNLKHFTRLSGGEIQVVTPTDLLQ